MALWSTGDSPEKVNKRLQDQGRPGIGPSGADTIVGAPISLYKHIKSIFDPSAEGGQAASGFADIARDYAKQRVNNMEERQLALQQQLKLFEPINAMLKAMYGPDAGFDLSALAPPPNATGLNAIQGYTDAPQGATDTPNGEPSRGPGDLGYGPAAGPPESWKNKQKK